LATTLENLGARWLLEKKLISLIFVNFSQRDEVIRALDQAAGISFDARTKRLSYSHYSTHKPGEK